MARLLKTYFEGGKRKSLSVHAEGGKASCLIYSYLMQSSPCMIARFGSIELDIILRYLARQKQQQSKLSGIFNLLNFNSWNDKFTEPIRNNAGFFSNSIPNIEEFCELMLKCMPNLDILGSWVLGENLVVDYFSEAALVPLMNIEPYYDTAPWSRALAGKKVLVIHPYEKTIQSQYQKNSFLFEDKSVLPNFELITIQAVQSIADQKVVYSDWFEALDYMKDQILKIDFDIAIIGCGAYGFPLASFVKDIGKKAVHMGGATQVLFGIKGRRWDEHPIISKLYNDYWVRPDISEVPEGSTKVEGNCYW